MSSKEKVKNWLLETPRHLTIGLFSVAAAIVVLILVVLLVVAPRIAAIPNRASLLTEGAPTEKQTDSRLLVTVGGKNFHNSSTLNLKVSDPGAVGLILAGLETLTYPVAVNSAEATASATPNSFRKPYNQPKYPARQPAIGANVKTNTYNANDPVSFAGMQAFHNDLSAKNFAAMARNCWYITPEVFTDRYTTDPARAALLQALSQKPKSNDQGVVWSGHAVEVRANWKTLSMQYSCPTVAYGGKTDSVTPEDVMHLVNRIMARSSYPVSSADTEANYPTLCRMWKPPKELTNISHEAAKKLTYDSDGELPQPAFKALRKLRQRSIQLYAVNNRYPMYLRASESQLKEPSAYFLRGSDGTLCIGAVVGN